MCSVGIVGGQRQPEKLATLGTQENKKTTIETSNIGYTRHRQRQPEKLAA
jgi:hypothetical protein